jgi:hypothetical protein
MKIKCTCIAKTVSAVANVLNVSPWTNYDNSVLRVQGYKFEALPNGEQLRNLRRFAGSCRFVYNQALALNKQRYENKKSGSVMRACALCCQAGRPRTRGFRMPRRKRCSNL